MLNAMTRWLAEKLFERELDEDYAMGTREGAEWAKRLMLMQLQLLHDQAPKSKQVGIKAAMEQLGHIS